MTWVDYKYQERVDSVPLPERSEDCFLGDRGDADVDCLEALINPLESIIGHHIAQDAHWSKLIAAMLLEHRHAANDLEQQGGDKKDIAPVLGPHQIMRLQPDGNGGFQFQLMQRQSKLMDDEGNIVAVSIVPYGSQPGDYEPEIVELTGSVKPAPDWVKQMHTDYWEVR